MSTIIDEVKSSLKALSEDAQYRTFAQGKNIYARIWRLKREEGVCSKGAYFRGTCSISDMIAQIFNCLQYTETEGEC